MRGAYVVPLFLIIGFAPAVAADSEAMPAPHVKSSPSGDVYAKSVPEGFDRMKGKTQSSRYDALRSDLEATEVEWVDIKNALVNPTSEKEN